MKRIEFKHALALIVAGAFVIVTALIPFHAFLTVWVSTVTAHYTAVRLWKEGLLVLAVLAACFWLMASPKTMRIFLKHKLTYLILAYILLQVLWGLWALTHGQVTKKALGYAWIVDLRFLLFFFVALVAANSYMGISQTWKNLVLYPAAIVISLAIIQELFLPPRFLEHFGYSKYTILPFQYVNNNPGLLRVQSTLRGANPLGAYLIVPISSLIVLLMQKKTTWINWVLLIAACVTVFFTFSRAAWVGALLSVCCLLIIWLQAHHVQWLFITVTFLLLLGAASTAGLIKNTRFQNIIFHAQTHSKVSTTSDQKHVSALKNGLYDLEHEPLGRGPGTAGPASVYNNKHPVRIAEDYFIQIGQEVGWAGLVLFLAINAYVGFMLWQRRDQPLASVLLASLIGISFVNLLSHAWTDDTLAYLWWGLAGVALSNPIKNRQHEIVAD